MATSGTPSSSKAPAAAKPPLPKLLLRRGVIAIALVVILLIPALVLLAATGQPAATYSALATIVGVGAVLGGGLRIGTITAIVLALLAPVAVISGLTPITGAALMAVMTMTVGRLATFGLHRATMLVPVMLAWPLLAPVPWLPHDQIARLNTLLTKDGTSLANALTDIYAKAGATTGASGSSVGDALSTLMVELRMNSTYLTWLVLFFFVGAIVPVIIAALMRHRLPTFELTQHARRETVPYTVVITVLCAGATYYFLNNPQLPGGAFFIAVILVLTQIGNDIAWRLTIERVVGTLVGVALFMGINALVGTTTFVEVFGLPFPLTIYLIGLVFAVGAIMAKFSPRHWIYFVLIVPTTAYLNAFTIESAAGLGKARLIDNAVGALLVVVAALITLGGSRLYERRFPADPHAPISASPA